MPSNRHQPNNDLLLYSLLTPLLLVLMLPDSAVAETANGNIEPSETTVSTQTVTPIVKIPRQELKPRQPVETPPTAYLPYPPPANYVWPPGMSPENQYPKYVFLRICWKFDNRTSELY